ncbi:biotin--[acetyl-CoA-carboxylase] ligase [Hoeflea sp. TYP-13]|uniref:biotin--[acetyl-CoA-carboxylase] ligase n=1 Tax=Hoeflea sp. TYP-13 TaxID=3230023 RepID=UPI0034C6504B
MSSPFADFRHIALGDVDSTNLECLDRAREGDAGNLWITANRQMKGRARRGRSWISEPGNLYASLLLIDPAAPAALASLPLAVAVAVHGAIARVMPQGAERPTIKWPNDVLIGGAKVSGILLESENLPDGRSAVVIGCGVNVTHAPDEVMYPATTLHAKGSSVSAEELFARLCQTMADALERWDEGRGISAIRQTWLDNAEGLGKAITVKLPDQTISGTFKDIDQSGCLVVVDEDKTVRTIAAGDVFFGQP